MSKDDKKKNDVINSGFRAVKNIRQSINTNAPILVTFETEQFDLNNEYNPVTSTFIPRQNGMYSNEASLVYLERFPHLDTVYIYINGNPVQSNNSLLIGDNDPLNNILSISAIFLLKTGDRVQIFAKMTDAIGRPPKFGGSIEVNSSFQVARFPSPSGR